MRGLWAAVLAVSLLGCRGATQDRDGGGATQDAAAEPQPPRFTRADVVDGLEAAVDDPEVDRAFTRTFEVLLGEPAVVEVSSRMLARVGQDEALAPAADAFFVELQASEAMRAALVAYAEQSPALDPAALAEGFVSYVDARLTRPELAALLRQALTAALARVGGSLGRALLVEAGGVEVLAEVVVDHLAQEEFAAALDARLGADPQRLRRRLADPERAVPLLLDVAAVMADAPAAQQLLVDILDDEAAAARVADTLRRLLADESVRAAGSALLTAALAEPLDRPAVLAAVDELVNSPVVQREAAALLGAIARDPATGERVRDYLRRHGQRPQLDAVLLDGYG